MAQASCPPLEQLRQFLRGQLPGTTSATFQQHLRQCGACASTVETLKRDDAAARSRPQEAVAPRQAPIRPAGKAQPGESLTVPPVARPDLQATAASLSPGQQVSTPVTSFDFLAPAQAANELGRLGPYCVRQVLGQGGMGVVFLADDPRLGRTVALKAMLPDLAQKPGARERFLREARAIAALEHDHIVAIYQVDEDRGVPYIAMPLLKGLSLEEWLKQKQQAARGSSLKPAQILKIGREIARGLGAAHERGLIHRDIKPANIWLDATAGGRVKLLDFGLARPTSGDQHLTQSGMIVGTPAYMAPEQAQGKPVDARTDLFSLGVVLYRLGTGTLPFVGTDTISTLMAVAMHEPTPPGVLNTDLPPALGDLIMKLLAKDPARRPASAQDVVQAILAIEKSQVALAAASVADAATAPETALRGAPRRRWVWPVVGTGVLLAGLVLILVVASPGGRVEPRKPTEEPTVAEGSRPSTDRDKPVTKKAPLLSESGKPVDKGETTPAPEHILPDPVAHRLEGHKADVFQVRFLNDGKRAASVAWDGTARLWDVATGKELRSFPKSNPWDKILSHLAVSPDDKILAVGGSAHRVHLWQVKTGKPLGTLTMHAASVGPLAFSPDGRQLLVGDGPGELWVFRVKDQECLVKIKVLNHGLSDIVPLPDGKRVLCCSGSQPQFALWDLEKVERLRLFAGPSCGVLRLALFQDGKRAASVHADGTARIWELETGAELARIEAHVGRATRATGVHVLANDQWLLTTGEDKAIRIWDVKTRRMVDAAKANHHVTAQSAVSRDGRLLVTGAGWFLTDHRGSDGDFALRLWRLPVPPGTVAKRP